MSKQYVTDKFHNRLIAYITYGRNDEAKSMLNKELAQANDADCETLLHYAARFNNVVIARELIALGADVDSVGKAGDTPLALAVIYKKAATANVLLEAKANLDIVDNTGFNSLQRALHTWYHNSEIVEAFARRLKSENRTSEELAHRLITGGCNMYHAAVLGDVKVMECMLRCGMPIDGDDPESISLYAAAATNQSNTAEWLLDHGADMNARNIYGQSALIIAAQNASNDVIKLLLNRGADPNCADTSNRTPLYFVFYNVKNGVRDFFECAELLLQHGAVPRNPTVTRNTMFDLAVSYSMDKTAKLVICHLAMLEMLGTSITKSVMYFNRPEYQPKQSELENSHEQCFQVLKVKVFEEFTLFDLLQVKEPELRLLGRKETFVHKVKKFCLEYELNELYPYYYNMIMKLIDEANGLVELEEQAFLVICKIFKSNYEQCYIFAKGVFGYLKVADLERLVQVC